jgi:hypothetical protein
MAIASFLSYKDPTLQITYDRSGNPTVGLNKVSLATPADMQFYDRAAYRRIEQVVQSDQLFEGDTDLYITSVLFPKASIELLNMMEFGFWPLYVERTLGAFYYTSAVPGQPKYSPGGPNQTGNPIIPSAASGMTMTAFNPGQLIKQNQTLIQLEIYKAVEIFYSTLVTDNSNINEKDAANLNFARKRYEEEWEKAKQESYWYDMKNIGFVGTYQQDWLADVNFFEGDRRYF